MRLHHWSLTFAAAALYDCCLRPAADGEGGGRAGCASQLFLCDEHPHIVVGRSLDDRYPVRMQTAKLTGEEVDAQDAFKLLRKVTLPPKWLPDDSEPLDMMAVRTAKVRNLRWAMEPDRNIKLVEDQSGCPRTASPSI